MVALVLTGWLNLGERKRFGTVKINVRTSQIQSRHRQLWMYQQEAGTAQKSSIALQYDFWVGIQMSLCHRWAR